MATMEGGEQSSEALLNFGSAAGQEEGKEAVDFREVVTR